MRITRSATFTIGVLVTAVSIGAVNFANAASDSKIRACANKKTGVMRYITKGSCKKTETKLDWNQIGPQGTPGATGATGATGISTSGVNGQNLYLVDGQDRQIGMVYGTQGAGNDIDFFYDGGIWHWSRGGELSGSLFMVNFYSDSACTNNLYVSGDGWYLPTDRGWNRENVNPRYFKPTGSRIATASTPVYGMVRSGTSPTYTYTCKISTDPSFISWFVPNNTDDNLPAYLTAVVEISPPQFTQPLRIVQR